MRPSAFLKNISLPTCLAITGVNFAAQSTAFAAGPAEAWSTCYVGGQAGGATSSARWDYKNSNFYNSTGNADPQLISGASFNDTRGVIGLQGGCNRAIGEWWVVGIEGAWFSNPLNEHNFKPGYFPDPTNTTNREVVTTNIQSVMSLTGRVGVAPSADWLLYAKGGYAAARIETEGRVTPQLSVSNLDFITTNWHSGWTAGAGVEYRLFRNITIGLEYDYYKFASVTHSGGITALDIFPGGTRPANPVLHDVNASVQTLMGRINIGLNDPTVDSSPRAAYAAYLKAPPMAVPAGNFSGFVTSEMRGSGWSGSRGANVFAPDAGKGAQVYSPTTIGIDYLMPSQYKFETRIKSGYVYSAQNTPGQVGRYEGPVDTQAAFNLTILSFDSFRPLFGLNLNLPTGNTYLPYNQRFTRMDPDLVDVGSYGTGFNVNPTAGVVFGIDEHTAISLSAGWTWQGPFTKEGISEVQVANPAPPPATIVLDTFDLKQRVDPGNTYTLNGNVSSTYGALQMNGSFAYMGDSHASIDGVTTGKAGAKLTANGSISYRFDERFSTALNVSWNFSERNRIANGFGGLIVEPKNSNSNVVIASFEPSYLVTDRLKIAGNYSYLYRDHNYYNPFEDQFISAKQKQTAGASASYALTEAATITVRGSHSWIRQEDGPTLVTTLGPPAAFALQPPALRYHSWAGSIGTAIRF